MPDDLAARLGIAVTRLARLLRHQDEGELTPTQRSALVTVSREGPITLGALAAREHVAPPTVTKVVTQLEEQGLLVRLEDGADRRICRVAVSDAGEARLAADRRRREAWLQQRLQDLDPLDREQLVAAVDVLERMSSRPAEVPV